MWSHPLGDYLMSSCCVLDGGFATSTDRHTLQLQVCYFMPFMPFQYRLPWYPKPQHVDTIRKWQLHPLKELPIVFTAHQQSCGKVMFSVMPVHSQRGGSCVTITHNAFDPSVQTPLSVQDPDPPLYWAPVPDPSWWHLMAKIGYLFKLLHLRTSLYSTPPNWCWHLVAVYVW